MLEEQDLARYLHAAPRAPGVYIMKDPKGQVLYVGKAKNVRARLKAYFSRTDQRPMIPFLLERASSIEFIVTDTEKDAFILEYNLIKKHKPRYNVLFRDDKAYFHLRLDPGSLFPRFQLVRRPRKDSARYFGPYPSGKAAKETLQFLHTLFPLRTCRDQELRNRSRPCLEYEMGRCLAPCTGRIDAIAYGDLVKESLAFMEGRTEYMLRELEKKMRQAAREERFEDAARIRDRLKAIRETLEKQAVYFHDTLDRDVLGYYREGDTSSISIIFVREGRVIDRTSFPPVKSDMDDQEILSQFLTFYYSENKEIPDLIIIPFPITEKKLIAEWLSEKKGGKVQIVSPRRGMGKNLLALARANAEQSFTEQSHREKEEEVLKHLAEILGMPHLPERIECYDISHLGGMHAVGAQVTFYSGKPLPAAYRHYRIRSDRGADDYAMMYEVLTRRLKRGDMPDPDLIIVDGGKGQLSVAQAALKDCGKEGIHLIAIAKGESKGGDHIFIPHRKDPLFLGRFPSLMNFLARIRDEAHRFAITYAWKKKEKAFFRSEMDGILGKGKKRALLAHFNSIEEIGQASVEELSKVKGIGGKTAQKIWQYFHQGEKDEKKLPFPDK